MSRRPRPFMHMVDVAAGPRTLRIAIEYGADSRPRELHFAAGHGRGREWRDIRGEGLSVPASAAGHIAAALDLLRQPASAPKTPDCNHPPRALVRPRLLNTTAGAERVSVADCLLCGEAVVIDADGGARARGRERVASMTLTMEG